jgi:hypothetical protein
MTVDPQAKSPPAPCVTVTLYLSAHAGRQANGNKDDRNDLQVIWVLTFVERRSFRDRLGVTARGRSSTPLNGAPSRSSERQTLRLAPSPPRRAGGCATRRLLLPDHFPTAVSRSRERASIAKMRGRASTQSHRSCGALTFETTKDARHRPRQRSQKQ